MKYFIAVTILLFVCITANAQTTAGKDDKAVGATIGQFNGYSYGVNFTIVKGKIVETCPDNNVCHMETIVTADKDVKPADVNAKKYSYEVIYTIKSGEIVQSGQK